MRSAIPWQEWDFDRCPEDEHGICYFYEVFRERVLRIKDSASFAWHKFVKDVRTSVGLNGPPSSKICTKIRVEICSNAHFWSVLAGFPEWPLAPYLSITREERQRRLEMLVPEIFPKQSPPENIIPERLPADYVSAMHAMREAGVLPMVKSDIASILDIELEARKISSPNWKQGEPAATVDGSIVTIKIPYDQGKEWFLRHAATLWEQAVPDEQKRKIHGGAAARNRAKTFPRYANLLPIDQLGCGNCQFLTQSS
jgi:hypothetical protein